ncbi:hypothetical protein [Nocardia terpenica]|uniref:Uncharacterized protein n=1 Tax=Nocardia terpenica TaxID=455432 RepID=A0A164KLH8_9NOCA|nr:hypothetical protein [Nocardia terpenica]KZM71516.1 hypothetical protein AWN90_01855 [Nocardia terpenica]NQE90701.1 hypothetical protein [Nocardia terpenica]
MAESVTPTVAERLAAADELLRGTVSDAGGLWSRATVWILRITLEQAIDQLWWRAAPALARCSMRAQLLALDAYAGPAVGARIAALWATLSRAGHHHDYELAPTVIELRGWYDETALLADELAHIGQSGPDGSGTVRTVRS